MQYNSLRQFFVDPSVPGTEGKSHCYNHNSMQYTSGYKCGRNCMSLPPHPTPVTELSHQCKDSLDVRSNSVNEKHIIFNLTVSIYTLYLPHRLGHYCVFTYFTLDELTFRLTQFVKLLSLLLQMFKLLKTLGYFSNIMQFYAVKVRM